MNSSDDEAFEGELGSSFSSDRLHLIILPTEQCNFRCTYCYEDFEIGRMTPAVVMGVKQLLDRRVDTLRELSLSWFGGEPLAARDIVEDISAHAARLVARTPALSYVGDMTTNGYALTLPVVDRLCRLGIREYQVSLDGPKDFHDRTRILQRGGGSFDRIWKNLQDILHSQLDVAVVIRVHLTPLNLEIMPDFLGRIRRTFLKDSRFRVFLKCIEPLGGPKDADLEFISHDDRSDILERLGSEVSGARVGGGVSEIEVCYASKPNSLVIRADGSIAKCTVALSDPGNNIGHLAPNGRLKLDSSRLAPWLRGWQSRDAATLSCPFDGFQPLEATMPSLSGEKRRNLIPVVDVSRSQGKNSDPRLSMPGGSSGR